MQINLTKTNTKKKDVNQIPILKHLIQIIIKQHNE